MKTELICLISGISLGVIGLATLQPVGMVLVIWGGVMLLLAPFAGIINRYFK